MFASTLVFYIRWNNLWFMQHAQAEFASRKFLADISRASWLAELYFEAAKAQAPGFPPEMIARFARNLFLNDPWSQGDMHPIGELVTALSQATKVKIDKAGSVEVERQPATAREPK